jgi:hypothetical protein
VENCPITLLTTVIICDMSVLHQSQDGARASDPVHPKEGNAEAAEEEDHRD